MPSLPVQPYNAKALPGKLGVNHNTAVLKAATIGDREELNRRIRDLSRNHQRNASRCELPKPPHITWKKLSGDWGNPPTWRDGIVYLYLPHLDHVCHTCSCSKLG